MRLFGWSFVQLENLHINKIMEIAKITNMNGSINNLDNGFYLAKYDNKTSTIYFEKKRILIRMLGIHLGVNRIS